MPDLDSVSSQSRSLTCSRRMTEEDSILIIPSSESDKKGSLRYPLNPELFVASRIIMLSFMVDTDKAYILDHPILDSKGNACIY